NNDAYSLNQDTVLTIAAPGVLANDTDVDGDPLTAILVSGPVHGTLTLNADGSFTYTPNAGYVGSDSFTYKANDGTADGNVATVSLTTKRPPPPVITLIGPNPMTINQGSLFTDPGATAVDNVDGSVLVSVSGSVNTAIPGTYMLTYSAQDAAGNKATKMRT